MSTKFLSVWCLVCAKFIHTCKLSCINVSLHLGFFNRFAYNIQQNWRRKQLICVFEKHINRKDPSFRLPYLFYFTLSAKYECESWQTKHQLFARMHWVKEATFYRPPMFPSCSEVKNKIIGKEILFLSYSKPCNY